MMQTLPLILLLFPFLVFGLSAKNFLQQTSNQDDKIQSLPGAAFEIQFDQYSGYLNVGKEKKYHYWLVESQRKPEKDPLLLWLNGGPGCSSLLGLLGENGPFRVDWKGKNIEENVYAWNKIANVVYLESPAGVGFSYAADGDTHYSDSLVAKENHLALLAFAAKFPNFKNRKFYISGESYAGVYIPTLSVEILKDNSFPFDYQGAAIGNGMYDGNLNLNTVMDYFFYHGLYADDLLQEMRKECKCTEYFCDYISQAKFDGQGRPLNECAMKIAAAYSATSGLDGYNIYDSCYENPKNSSPKISHYVPREYIAGIVTITPVRDPNHCNLTYNPVARYLNDPKVRKALNIPDHVHAWQSCGGLESYDSDLLDKTMTPQFVTMLKSRMSLLIYHGDFDSVCGFLEGQQFLRSEKLGLKIVGKRQQWKYSNDIFPIAGYWDKFEQNIDFLTVRGAGHFVPADKPREALQMIGNFLEGTRDYSLPVHVDLTPATTFTPPVTKTFTMPRF